MKFFLSLLSSFLLLSACTNSPVVNNEHELFVQNSINKHAETLLSNPNINAVSIGIYQNGKKHTGHFGELDPGQGNTPNNQTIYEIASVSKTFTGLLVAQAVIDGKLNIDDDVNKYLNNAYPNFYFADKPIKIRHLITHTSGLPDFLPNSINALFDDGFTEDLPFKMHAQLASYNKTSFLKDLKQFKQTAEPGKNYAYSNVDTELMAHILETVYAKEFQDLLQEYITTKINIPDTRIKLNSEQEKRLAKGYGMTNKLVPYIPYTLWGADGGIKSTTADLLNFMQLQLNSSNPSVKKSHEIVYNGEDEVRGFYWPIENNQEYGSYLRHHGGAFGTQNWFLIIPKYDLGISVITNQSGLETAGQLMTTVNGILDDLTTEK